DGVYSPAVSSTIIPPGTPESLVARIGTTNQINLSWSDRYYDHDGFRLERAPDVGGMPGSWMEIAVLPATNSYDGSFTDTNVTALTTNWYRVRAFNGVGLSAYVAPINVAVITPPAPIYSEASVNRDQVDFHWSGDYYAYGEVAGYKVERAPDVGGNPGDWLAIGQTLFDETHFSDSGRPANTTWWYRARAYNWIGEGLSGPAANATIRPPMTPFQVYGRISASNQVDLNWYFPAADEDGFQLERAPDDGGVPGTWKEIALIAITNSVSGYFADTNLTGPTTNWYRVRAFNVVGASDYSSPAAMPMLPPQPPYSVWAAPDRNQILVNWSVYYDNYGYVEGFKIERAPDLNGSPGNWSQIGTLPTTNPYGGDFDYADTGLGLNTSWWYRVRPYNWTGDGDYSPLAHATIVSPAAPAWLAGKIGSTNEVILSLYQSQTDVDGFRFEHAPDDGGVPGVWTEIGIVSATNASSAEFTDTNATAFTTNWYRARAFNLFGNSDYSEPALVAVVPPPAPYPVYAQAYRDRINVSWSADFNSYGTNDGFKIERAPDVGGEPGTWSQVGQVGRDINSYSDSNLVLNATWWYRVSAYNWIGDGEPSQEAYATILPPGAPDSIAGRISTTNQVKLSWHDSTVDEDGFRLERATDDNSVPGTWNEIGIIAATNVSDIEFTDTNAIALTTYWYRVRAFNALGESDYSVSTAMTVLPPPAPYLSANVFRDQVNLFGYIPNIDAYGQVDGYRLERAPDVSGKPGAWSQIAPELFANPYGNYISYTDPARPVNTTFWYRLHAFNWVGEGDYSPAVSATAVPPAIPSNLYGALGSTNQINLVWYDYSPDEDGFQLERAPDTNGIPGAWQEIAVIPATNSYYANYTDTNVTAYTTNWYRVRAYSSLGASGYSTAIRVKAVPPDAPSLFNTLYYGPANLYWSPNDPAQGSELERATNTATGPAGWASVRRYDILCAGYYDDTNIVAGGSYAYRAKAFNWVGDSPWSPVVVINIPALTPSLAGVSASASTPALRITSLILTNENVLISWDALGGTTNVVEATADLADGFADISGPLTFTGSGVVATNYLDSGALTNANRRFYRIKVP
ncbi:MAG: fibronectin type III domain-containing protein, partial [Verrucomicrobiota bacterium]